MAAIGVHARLDRSTAVVPDRIRWPGVDIAFVYSVLIRVEALAHPLKMQFQSRSQERLELRIGSRPPVVDDLIEELLLHVVNVLIPINSADTVVSELRTLQTKY